MEPAFFDPTEIDPIHSKDVEKEYGISPTTQITLLDSGKVSVYERYEREPCLAYQGMPEPQPRVRVESKVQYRRLGTYETGGLTVDLLEKFYFSRIEIGSLDPVQSKAKPNSRKDAYRIVAGIIRKELADPIISKLESADDQLKAVLESPAVKGAIRKYLGDIKTATLKAGLRRHGFDVLPKPRGGRGKKAA